MATLAHRLLERLGHTPTAGQQKAIEALDRLMGTGKPRATLVLKGYAGTGKTTLVGALVKVLAESLAMVSNAARDGIDTAEEEKDMVTSDLLTGLSGDLDKQLYFLESHLR